jgi:DNA-binding protein HU-beta
VNKTELVTAMADKAGVTHKQAGDCLDAFFDVVAGVVSKGDDKLSIPGWMTIEQRSSKARIVRRPGSTEMIHVPAKKTPKLSAGSKLKAAANS